MQAAVLEFKLLGQTYCFSSEHIAYVFELESYQALQGLHPSVRGITQYNHDVMLLIDTAYLYSGKKLLDMHEEKSVVVIIDENKNYYGMIVDEIVRLEEIETVDLSFELHSDMIVNHYKDKDTDSLVSEIHPLPLLKKYAIAALAYKDDQAYKKDQQKECIKTQHNEEYLLFSINNHLYAIATQYVQEVIQKEGEVFPLDPPQQNFKGALAIRDEVVTIVSLQNPLRGEDIVILRIGDKKFGIEVDTIYDIESFSPEDFENIEDNKGAIEAFYNYHNEVLALLNPHYFCHDGRVSHTTQECNDKELLNTQEGAYLIFTIENQKYAVDMRFVRQVTQTQSLQKTQSAAIHDEHIEFITTWNHQAIHLIRLDKALSLSYKNIEQTQAVFIENENHCVAFLVDEIEDIIYLKNENITQSVAEDITLIGGALLYNDTVIVQLNEHAILTMG